MTRNLERLWSDLQKRYRVTVSFYPGFSLEELPRGYITELDGIFRLLERKGVPTTTQNVYHVMKARRELIRLVNKRLTLRKRVLDLSSGRVGITGDPVYDLAIIIIPFVIFGKGFFTRLGERLADGLMDYLVETRDYSRQEAKVVTEIIGELSLSDRKKLLRFRMRRTKQIGIRKR